MSIWTKIEDKIPPTFEYVLVFGEMKGTNEPCPISIARHDGDGWEMLVNDENNAVASGDLTWSMEEEDITHWTPLPDEPRI